MSNTERQEFGRSVVGSLNFSRISAPGAQHVLCNIRSGVKGQIFYTLLPKSSQSTQLLIIKHVYSKMGLVAILVTT